MLVARANHHTGWFLKAGNQGLGNENENLLSRPSPPQVCGREGDARRSGGRQVGAVDELPPVNDFLESGKSRGYEEVVSFECPPSSRPSPRGEGERTSARVEMLVARANHHTGWVLKAGNQRHRDELRTADCGLEELQNPGGWEEHPQGDTAKYAIHENRGWFGGEKNLACSSVWMKDARW